MKTVNYDTFFSFPLCQETLEQYPGFLPSRITVLAVFCAGESEKLSLERVSADMFQPGLFQKVERG